MARKANTSVNFSNLHTEQDWEELCKRQEGYFLYCMCQCVSVNHTKMRDCDIQKELGLT